MMRMIVGACLLGALAPGCASKAGEGGAWVTIDSAQVSKDQLAEGESLDFSWRVSHTKESGYVTQVGLFVGSEEAIRADAPDTLRLFDRSATGNIDNNVSGATVSCKRNGNSLGCGGASYDL